jgi:DNA polymerase III subunit delta'
VGILLTRGHPAAVTVIGRAIRRGRAPHALLLTGPDGCGKTTLALDLAAGLLCLAEDPDDRPCRTCAACRKVAHGNHPDLHRLAPEGAGEQIRLGAVQSLISDLALMPMEARLRVCVIEDAHRLNPDAQNALLKALEEPVGETCICLCADDTAQLLPTIMSRTERLRLGPVPVSDVVELLVERGAADVARAREIAVLSEGRPGYALQLAADPQSTLVRARLARQLLDLIGADRRQRLAAASELIATGASMDADSGASGARMLPAQRRRAVVRVLDVWRRVGRDLALAASGERAAIHQMDLLEDLESASLGLDRGALIAFLDRADALSAAVESYASPELALDSLLLSWPSRRHAA